MPIRITGMNSGLDTEAIIQELASARSIKVQSVEKAQTKLSWKIDAWKSLNTKIYSLYTDVLSDMRLEGSYSKKTTKVSNEAAVDVITGAGATNGVQTLKIKQLAKSGYLTGAKIADYTDEKGEKVSPKSTTTLKDLGLTQKPNADGTPGTFGFKLRIGDETSTLTFSEDSTIDDVVKALKEKGLNANFDEENGRFFVSSSASGEAYDFEITAKEGTRSELALKGLGLYVNSSDKLNEAEADNVATKIDGQDAIIYLNGAKFTSDTNTFEINGLTYTVKQETGDEEITVTTDADTSGIYDMIKNFLTKYNELINEMDKLYNADSAKNYEPLTDDEKESMSEKEIEKWEQKIKDSLLRRDSTLSGVSSALKMIMSQGVEMSNGEKMYLSNFGIETLSYFTAKDNEKNAYHIDGDSDDAETKSKDDKLKTAIANDPDTVVEFFTKLSKNLYDTLYEKMDATDYSSMYTVYNDKQMKEELKDYEDKISAAQDKLNDYLDKMYDKFSAMEVALAKMQSKSDSLMNLFG